MFTKVSCRFVCLCWPWDFLIWIILKFIYNKMCRVCSSLVLISRFRVSYSDFIVLFTQKCLSFQVLYIGSFVPLLFGIIRNHFDISFAWYFSDIFFSQTKTIDNNLIKLLFLNFYVFVFTRNNLCSIIARLIGRVFFKKN